MPDIVAIASRARSTPDLAAGSLPSTMFSHTVRLSANMKCWCTMPMPAAMASAGEPKTTVRPSTSMVPSSGLCIP